MTDITSKSIIRKDPTKPTMGSDRFKGQPRIPGKGRLRRRNIKLEHGLATRGLDYGSVAQLIGAPKRSIITIARRSTKK